MKTELDRKGLQKIDICKMMEKGNKSVNEKKRASPCHIWNKCAGCSKRIRSRYLVTSLGRTWHEACLTCDCCNEILFSFREPCMFYKDGHKLCKIDYLRLYGNTGICSMCDDIIQPTEKVMRFKDKFVYHQACFRCVECQNEFQKGDFAGIPHPKQILCYQHYSIHKANALVINNQYSTEQKQLFGNDQDELLMNRACNNSLQCALFQDIPSPIMFESQCSEVQKIRREKSESITKNGSEHYFEQIQCDYI